MAGNMPGAGSRTSVRSWWRARRSLRYWASSAWQRRHESTWRTTLASARSWWSTTCGNSSAIWSHCTDVLLSVTLSQLPAQWEEALPQSAPGPVEADLGRPFRDTQLGGDGLVGEVVHVTQHHDGAHVGREGLERFGQPRALGGDVRPQLGVDLGPLIDQRVVVREVLVPVARTTGQVRRRAVGRDAIEPRGEGRVATEALEALVGPQIRVLHHVSRILLVPGEPVGERVRLGVRRSHQLIEGR